MNTFHIIYGALWFGTWFFATRNSLNGCSLPIDGTDVFLSSVLGFLIGSIWWLVAPFYLVGWLAKLTIKK